ncbi:hypothetical protein [Kineococcus sp. R86509]|uniref:hypothetical protein n=1 Tax=Kineococcus sp. R86509 TaxID=3093851 RepID=UPI0036D3393D
MLEDTWRDDVVEAWVSDEDLRAAFDRFATRVPGFVMPVAYTMVRQDGVELTFAHINHVGAVRPLPAVVLASVCGYVATTGVFALEREQLARVVELLGPAKAAIHMPHPNLWSWRELLTDAEHGDRFYACFLADVSNDPVDAVDAHFRLLLTAGAL